MPVEVPLKSTLVRTLIFLGECEPNQSSDHHFSAAVNNYDELTKLSLFLCAASHVFGGVSKVFGEFIMRTINVIINLASQHEQPLPAEFQKHLPQTISTALAQFNLNGRTTPFAVCPTCHFTYRPRTTLGKNHYPQQCTNQEHLDERVCGERLLTSGPVPKPIKTFVYHEFSDYLSGLLSRPDIEAALDKSCENFRDLLAEMETTSNEENLQDVRVKDVFGGDFFKSFRDYSGQHLFLEAPSGEGRLAFALNVDFFHPEGISIHAAAVSCGIITMACLNLPVNIRYKPENLYLAGIIPGPNEPPLTSLNYYLRPLIDDLVASWERGHHFSRTALKQTGRLCRCAIAMAVCDLQAARKASQTASVRSHFYCTVCQCHHTSTLGRTDVESWIPRDAGEMRHFAEAWRDAPTRADRKRLFSAHGVRWSELWRLPYWDPTRQLVVDSMHCLFENLVQYHVRELLQLTEQSDPSESLPAFTHNFKSYNDQELSMLMLSKKDIIHVSEIHNLLTEPIDGDSAEADDDTATIGSGDATSVATERLGSLDALQKKLLRKTRGALAFVCCKEVANISESSLQYLSKSDIVDALLSWVSPIFDHNFLNSLLIHYSAHDKASASNGWLKL